MQRSLFTASKNIDHSPSYEQSSIAHKSLNYHNTLPHRTGYARLIKSSTTTRARARYYVPLTTILLITIHIIHYTHHRYYTPITPSMQSARGHPHFYNNHSVTHRKPQIIYMIIEAHATVHWAFKPKNVLTSG